MASPDGRPVFIKRVPWHKDKRSTLPSSRQYNPTDTDPVYVDPSGQFVNSEGEPLSQEDYDSRPKGV